MRLVKVAAPEGKGADIAQIAFFNGIENVSLRQIENLSSSGKSETKDVIDIETSTPKAKRFVDALLQADFYNREDYVINTRSPRSLISRESLHELTKPMVEPPTDILEELWQFSHITYGFVGRVFIAAGLIAYGLIEQKTLIIIAGLLFLPLLPLLLAVSFGVKTKTWKLAGQGALAFTVATVLLFLGGATVAAVSQPPIKFNEFNSLLVGFLITLAVAVAAVLANIDDAGRRELIGLAATAQIAVVPVWFGICAVFGFPATEDKNEIITLGGSFFLNALTIVVVTFILYAATGAVGKIKKD